MYKKITDNLIANIVGAMFLLTLIVPLLNYVFVFQKLVVPNNFISTADKIFSNEFLFRINILNEVITALIVMGLAVSLYILLKSVNKNISIFALCLKITEATIWTTIAVGHLIMLLLLKGQSFLFIESQHFKSFFGLIIDAHLQVTAIPGMLHGLCLVLFLYLLYKSDLVPRKLATFGIVSFALVFAYDLMLIISPEYTSLMFVQIIGWVPSIIFELIIGLWLLIKGIKVPQN